VDELVVRGAWCVVRVPLRLSVGLDWCCSWPIFAGGELVLDANKLRIEARKCVAKCKGWRFWAFAHFDSNRCKPLIIRLPGVFGGCGMKCAG
jgi:hypothetical protein